MIEAPKDKLNTGEKKLEDLEVEIANLNKEQIEKQKRAARLIKSWRNENDPNADSNWQDFEKQNDSSLNIDSEGEKS